MMTMQCVSYSCVAIVSMAAFIKFSQAMECDVGYYGDTCSSRCGHCDVNNTCDQQTGTCHEGCKPGYQGMDCRASCDDGTFGKNCIQTCKCINAFPCNKFTGVCYCIVNGVVPDHGSVDQIVGKEVSYLCNPGYQMVGSHSHKCLGDGSWSHPAPRCEQKRGACPGNTDSKGTFWSVTQAGSIQIKSCASGFAGNVTRQCKWDATWFLPRYNCIRSSVQEIHNQIGSLSTNATHDDLNKALQDMVQLTNDDDKNSALTDGELGILSASLDNVANVMLTSAVLPTENLTNHFLESVNNLIDTKTYDDWKSINNAGDLGAVKILSAVDTFAVYFGRTLNSTNRETQTVVKENIAIEVKLVTNTDIVFPDTSVKHDLSVKHDWIKTSTSSISLQSSALKDSSIQRVTTAVMYKDISEILPTTTEGNTHESSSSSIEHSKHIINGPILSLSISPPVTDSLNPPVKITFQHKNENYKKPSCSFWQFDSMKNGYWSEIGCNVSSTNETVTLCECNHLTNFAVLMSPFEVADEVSFALEMISILCMSVSIVCLVVTCGIHIWLWKYLKKGRTYLLMHLCVALIVSYVLFLAGADRVHNKTVCTVVAALLQYIFLVVFCVMLAEGIEIAITILYVFQTRRSAIKWLLIGAWGLPAIIVGITLGVTKLEGFGNDKYCWLSIDNGLIWAFVGPALAVIVFNIICLCLVLRALYFTRAMEMKKRSEQVMTGLRSLCVLVPVTGVSWVLGIFYINDNTYFMQYVFAVCNGLQGVFVFLFHCLLNPQVKVSFLKRTKKYNISGQSKSTSKGPTHTDKISRGKREFQDLHSESTSYAAEFLNNTFDSNLDSKTTVCSDNSVDDSHDKL